MFAQAISLDGYSAKRGAVVGKSDWVLVDQDLIDSFANTTMDRQYIHVQPDLAAETPFGGTIAHGFLTLSLLTVMAEKTIPGILGSRSVINYGLDGVRFLAPVRSGKRIRSEFKLEDLTMRSEDRWLSTLSFSIEIEGEDRLAAIGRWLSLTLM